MRRIMRGCMDIELAVHQVAYQLLVLRHHELANDILEAIGLQDVGVACLARREDRPLMVEQRGYGRAVDAAVFSLDVIDLSLELEVGVVTRQHSDALYKAEAEDASLFNL